MERFWYHCHAVLKIRLKRVGRKNQPAFRVVVTDSRTGPKSNKHVAEVGSYNPRTKERRLDGEAIKHWIGNGAQVSGTVYNMLVDEGIVEGKKKNVLPRKSPIVKEEETSAGESASTEEETSSPSTEQAGKEEDTNAGGSEEVQEETGAAGETAGSETEEGGAPTENKEQTSEEEKPTEEARVEPEGEPETSEPASENTQT